jgi:tetratricopeptide (TPR) repeat protein
MRNAPIRTRLLELTDPRAFAVHIIAILNLPVASFKREDIMSKLIKYAAIIFVGVVSHSAFAGAPASMDAINGALEACYQETVKALAGAGLDKFGTTKCNRALHYSPNRELKASTLHNRGIVELYSGNEEAAAGSWERAVALSDQVGITHFALAQLAYRRGDLARAYDLYAALMKCNLDAPDLAGYKDTIQNNFQLVRARVQASK